MDNIKSKSNSNFMVPSSLLEPEACFYYTTILFIFLFSWWVLSFKQKHLQVENLRTLKCNTGWVKRKRILNKLFQARKLNYFKISGNKICAYFWLIQYIKQFMMICGRRLPVIHNDFLGPDRVDRVPQNLCPLL